MPLMPRSRALTLILTLVGVPSLALGSLACDDKGSKSDSGAASADAKADAKVEGSSDAAACDEAHGKAIEQEMLSWCEYSEKVASEDLPLAPWKPAPVDRPAEGRIEVRPGSVRVGFGPPTPASVVAGRLAEEREAAKLRGEAPKAWALTIGGDTPRAEVAAVVKALADTGEREGSLVLTVEPTEPVPQPRDPKRLAELDGTMTDGDPSMRATLLAREIQTAMPPCPGMVKTFSAVASAAPDQRCPLIARGISEGLVSCQCPKEDEMLTLIYAASLGSTPPTRLSTVAAVTLDPAATPRAGATWSEIVAGLDEAALKSLWVD